ncbi:MULTISPECIES: VF530 family protein [Reichenbachiella]
MRRVKTKEGTIMEDGQKKGIPGDQINNPLHGVKLAEILEFLVDLYGWDMLSKHISINCFKNNQTIKSSLKFLRRTLWAREQVEQLYLRSLKKKVPHVSDRLSKNK